MLEGAIERDGAFYRLVSGVKLNSVDMEKSLEFLHDGPITISAFADEIGVARKTATNALRDLEDERIVRSSRTEYELTGFGVAIERELRRVKRLIDTSAFHKLIRSENWHAVLNTLKSGAVSNETVESDCGISKRTRHRVLGKFASEGWLANELNGHYKLSREGESALAAFEYYNWAIQTLYEKRPFLIRIKDRATELSIEALADSELTISVPSDVEAVQNRIKNRLDYCLEHHPESYYRSLCQSFSPTLCEASPRIGDAQEGNHAQVVIERSIYRAMCDPSNWRYLRMSARADVELLVNPNTVTTGIMVVDGDFALVGAYSEEEPLNASIDGEHPDLIEWAEELYEEHLEPARPPMNDIYNWVTA